MPLIMLVNCKELKMPTNHTSVVQSNVGEIELIDIYRKNRPDGLG